MEDQLERLLRELPREQARYGFTARVLARLDRSDHPDRKPAPRMSWRPRLATAAAVVMLAGSALGLVRYERIEARRAARQARAEQVLRELRAEHGQIKRELEALPDPPVVYLGGNEDMDLVVDLRRVHKADGVQPATYSHNSTETF